MVGGRGIRLNRESIVRDSELFLALDPREERRQGTLELQVRLASVVRLEWLEELLPGLLRRERIMLFDPDRERVVGATRLWYLDLLIREDANQPVQTEEASRVLFEAMRDRAESLFLEDAAASAWLARYEFVSGAIPELEWPEIGRIAFEELIELICQGTSKLEDVRRADLVACLEGRLTPTLLSVLRKEAPAAITVPSGRQVKLTYEPGRPPVLAVRLQEVFGWTETPTLAWGRVPVLLHLLGPNYRPVQVTSDLNSFWTTTYHQVRKDLRGRYPKHAWPEDPLTAPAVSGPKRKPV
jgi:ATP-dependent helicase HrpB